MHQDCYETYLISQIRKATEQDNMVTDSTKYQYLCPLCKKLGNVFIPYVEVDSGRIEVREGCRAKAAGAMRKKLASEGSSGSSDGTASTTVVDSTNTANATTSITTNTTEVELPVAFRMDMTHLEKSNIPILPGPVALLHTTTTSPTTSTSSDGVWNWVNWIRHPSMINQDMCVYYKYNTSVSFRIDPANTSTTDSTLKRMRSATSDSTDLGHVHSKLNTNPSTSNSMDVADGEAAGAGMFF